MSVGHANDANILTLLTNQSKVIIKYYADWCGSCKLFAPKFKSLSEDERFSEILFIEINAEYNPLSRKLAGVYTLPFLATYNNGQLIEAKNTTEELILIEMLNNI